MGKKRLRDMTWDDYGISRNRYKELKAFCLQYEEKKKGIQHSVMSRQSVEWQAIINAANSRDCRLIEEAAIRANPGIWKHILKSVTQDLPYKYVEYSDEFGRIMVCRTDFYAYRRLFYYYLDGLKIGYKLREPL